MVEVLLFLGNHSGMRLQDFYEIIRILSNGLYSAVFCFPGQPERPCQPSWVCSAPVPAVGLGAIDKHERERRGEAMSGLTGEAQTHILAQTVSGRDGADGTNDRNPKHLHAISPTSIFQYARLWAEWPHI